MTTTENQPLKEYESHSSPQLSEEKSLDEIFKEAQQDGSLYE